MKVEDNTQNIRCPDSWGISQIKVISIKYLWRIVNFSFWDQEETRYLESPIFTSDTNSDMKWQLRLYVYTSSSIDEQVKNPGLALQLSLISSDETSIKAKCNFYILNQKKGEDFVKTSLEFHKFKRNGSSALKVTPLIHKSRLTPKESGLLVDDTLSIVCEIHCSLGSAYMTSHEISSNANKEDVLEDLRKLQTSGKLTDVTLVEKGGRELRAHRAVLAARSPVFAAMFELQPPEVRLDDVDERTASQLVRYCYTDALSEVDGLAAEQLVALLAAADKYELAGLKRLCSGALCERLDPGNALQMLEAARRYQAEGLDAKATALLMAEGADPRIAARPWISCHALCSYGRFLRERFIDKYF